jgi:hypothetical protein
MADLWVRDGKLIKTSDKCLYVGDECPCIIEAIDDITIVYKFEGIRDVDTQTKINVAEGSVGWDCGYCSYMSFSGDDTSYGSETVTIFVNQLRQDGLIRSKSHPNAAAELVIDMYACSYSGESGQVWIELTMGSKTMLSSKYTVSAKNYSCCDNHIKTWKLSVPLT